MGKSTKWLGKFLIVKKFKSSSKEKPSPDSPQNEELEKISMASSPIPNYESPSDQGDLHSVMEGLNESVALPLIATNDSSAVSAIPEGFISTGNAAAIKIQTAFRAFLVTKGVMVDDFVQARRALRALKGLVRLQALVRGHSVRKQAAISLRTVLAIVKVQAHARGNRVRFSDEGQNVQKHIWNKRQGSTDCLVEERSAAVGDRLASMKFDVKQSKAEVSQFDQKLMAYAPKDFDHPSWFWLEFWTAAEHWKPAQVLPLNSSDINSLKNGELNGNHSSLGAKNSGKRNSKSDRSVPSYMAATESAKAKARANGSPKIREMSTAASASASAGESPRESAVDKVSPAFKRRFSLPGTNGRFQDPITHPRRLSFPVRAR